jgi:hypothetical protein
MNTARHRTPQAHALSSLQFLVLASNFLLKVVIFNVAYLIQLVVADFGTDLFAGEVRSLTFLFCVLVVNLVTYAFYRGFTTPILPAQTARVSPEVNALIVGLLFVGMLASYLALGQKTLSLSSSTALLAIAANSRAAACLGLAIFTVGVPEAIAQDEYIPIIFCAVLNIYVFLPWLLTRARRLLYVLGTMAVALVATLSAYYVTVRYNLFKLIERVFEQAAPLSWEGSPLLWFNPKAVVGGMPDERTVMAMDGVWDAQFKVTYLIVNAPVFGSAFLLVFAFALGLFCARTLSDCRLRHTNVLKNFLKLKLIMILVEVLGEKLFDLERIAAYLLMIAGIVLLETLWTSGKSTRVSAAR